MERYSSSNGGRKMKVFISHKSDDLTAAKEWGEKLVKKGFDIYLDAYDEQIKTASDRPNHIQGEIKKSTDLLVIITGNTQTSWWVPFEIGLSTAFDKRIASLVFSDAGNLPSFLRKWPVIDTEEKWKVYLKELSKKHEQRLLEALPILSEVKKSEENFSFLTTIRESDLFHSVLKARFGQ